MIIYLPTKITNLKLYRDVLPKLTQYYLSGEKENPAISFAYTEWIDMESIPVLMGILDIIYNVNKLPVRLELVYRPHLLYLLYHTLFFYYAGEKGLGYIDYDKDFVGGFSDYIGENYRTEHIMHVYEPEEKFFDYSLEIQLEKRAKFYEDMRYGVIQRDFNVVLKDIKQLWQNQMDNFQTLLAELVANARLYSMSKCYTLLYSDRYKTIISICDVGRGFKYSLDKKRGSVLYPEERQKKFEDIKNKYNKRCEEYRLDDFFDILEALYYAELQNRINLYELKKIIVKNKGILRIQSGSVQVIFTAKRCGECQDGILSCVECLLRRQMGEVAKSAVRSFDSRMKGVRVEIEFER